MDKQQSAARQRRLHQRAGYVVHVAFYERRSCGVDAEEWYTGFAGQLAVGFYERPAYSSTGLFQRCNASGARIVSTARQLLHGRWEAHRALAGAARGTAQSRNFSRRAGTGKKCAGGARGRRNRLKNDGEINEITLRASIALFLHILFFI